MKKIILILPLVLSLLLACDIISTGYDERKEVTGSATPAVTFDNATTPGDVVSVTAGTAAFDMIYANNAASITFPTGLTDDATATIDTKFFMGKTEVTYELWSAVYTWATSGTGATGAGEYIFANAGLKGSSGGSGSNQQPVTTINWRDAMVWCNALTEYYNDKNGTEADIDCVYYSTSNYSTPVRTSTNSTTTTETTGGSQDLPYIKASSAGNTNIANCTAKGFRLPTSMEWEYAARYRGTDATNVVTAAVSGTNFSTMTSKWTKGNSASGATSDYTNDTATFAVGVFGYYSDWTETGVTSTAAVMSKGAAGANSLGLYDMSGNVIEWCFDLIGGIFRWSRGAHWYSSSENLQVGAVGNAYPYSSGNSGGFRFARTQ